MDLGRSCRSRVQHLYQRITCRVNVTLESLSRTMNRSDSRPRLRAQLRLFLAAHPHRSHGGPGRASWCPEESLSYVMPSPTPAKRYHLAISMVHLLPSLTGTDSASATFYLSTLNPASHMNLSRLRTSRYRNACKTRPRSARCGFDRTGLAPASYSAQFDQRTPVDSRELNLWIPPANSGTALAPAQPLSQHRDHVRSIPAQGACLALVTHAESHPSKPNQSL